MYIITILRCFCTETITTALLCLSKTNQYTNYNAAINFYQKPNNIASDYTYQKRILEKGPYQFNEITSITFNMDETYRNSYHYALVCTGVYIFSTSQWNTTLKFAHQIFNSFIAISIFIFTTGFIITRTDDVVVWIEGICIWITGVISYITVAVSLIFRKEFRRFLEEMAFKDAMLDMPFIDYVMKISCEKGKFKELKVMVLDSQVKLLKYSVLLLKCYTASVLSTAALYIIDAIYQMIVREDESLRLLGFEMWFPWKLKNFNVYIATFIFHVYAGFFCSMGYPTFQSTVVFLIGQIIRQLRILTFILEHLDDLVVEIFHERDERWQKYCTSVLSQCVDHYVMIKTFSNRLNRICRNFYLPLILNAMMLVCVCSVKIAISSKLSHELIKYYMHAFFFTLMVLLFCYMGQQVQNECEKLENAVTDKWYIFNRKHTDNIKIFHFALSQKMPILIFGSIPLSLPTFTWFMQTAMSFFTLAMSVLEE